MQMFNQYLLIVFASIFRFIFDAMVAANSVVSSSYQDKCPSDELITVKDTIVNALASFTTHLMPIFILLRIYPIEEQTEDITKSLIITSEVEKKGDSIDASRR